MSETTKTTTVRLLSHSTNIKETIYCQWRASRESGYVPTPQQVANWLKLIRSGEAPHSSEVAPGQIPEDTQRDYKTEVDEIFNKVIAMRIPLSETIHFVFELDHVSIALREQLVRHRIGHRFGSQLGADIIPDLSESSFWAQTMRVKDMSTFADEGEYLLPESVVNNKTKIDAMGSYKTYPEVLYRNHMRYSQACYKALVDAGCPVEEARNVLPLAVQHRMSWSVNLSALMHVFSKRTCWIAQLGMWEPVVRGVAEALAELDPAFRSLAKPPCIGPDDQFNACVFKLENENRVTQEDPYSPCPLYMYNHADEVRTVELTVRGKPVPAWTVEKEPGEECIRLGGPTVQAGQDYATRTGMYAALWGRDAVSGELLPPEQLGRLKAEIKS